MAWDDKIQRGKLGEAEFFTDGVENRGGKRLAEHEYPLRDVVYIEDLGNTSERFYVDCFVIGDDYVSDRDALLKELKKSGKRVLVHPYRGNKDVHVVSWGFSERWDEGRMARFSIEYVEAGKNDTPSEDDDTASIITEKVNGGILASNTDFASVFNVAGYPDFVSTDAANRVTDALDLIEVGSSTIAAVTTIRDNVGTAINNPLQLAADIASAIGQTSGVDTLRGIHAYGDDLPAVAETSASRIALVNNRVAIISMVRTAAVLETARLLV